MEENSKRKKKTLTLLSLSSGHFVFFSVDTVLLFPSCSNTFTMIYLSLLSSRVVTSQGRLRQTPPPSPLSSGSLRLQLKHRYHVSPPSLTINSTPVLSAGEPHALLPPNHACWCWWWRSKTGSQQTSDCAFHRIDRNAAIRLYISLIRKSRFSIPVWQMISGC